MRGVGSYNEIYLEAVIARSGLNEERRFTSGLDFRTAHPPTVRFRTARRAHT